MDTPTKILSDEHKNILIVIDALLMECDRLELGGEIDGDFFKKAIEFIRGYADKFHHAKEEDILFVELSKDGIQMHCNPVEQMLYEHGLGREFVKNLEQGLAENNAKKIIENARGYSRLLQEHIFKEDNILYPMADEFLGGEILDAVRDKFAAVEQKFNQDKERYFLFIRDITEGSDR